MRGNIKTNKNAQIVIETALILVVLAIFLMAIMRIWAWFVNTYTGRWNSYQATRTRAGQLDSRFVPDGYNKDANRLNLF